LLQRGRGKTIKLNLKAKADAIANRYKEMEEIENMSLEDEAATYVEYNYLNDICTLQEDINHLNKLLQQKRNENEAVKDELQLAERAYRSMASNSSPPRFTG
jgi:hypothetical protein